MTHVVLNGPLGFGEDVTARRCSRKRLSARGTISIAVQAWFRARGHPLEGVSIAGKILVLPAVKGGVAAGWALLNLRERGIAPLAIICSKTNPVFVQGCVVANIPIMHRLHPDPFTIIQSGCKLHLAPSAVR